MDNEGASPAKRPRNHYHRHHAPSLKSQILPPGEPAILEQESLDILLVGCIKTICEEQGVRNGIYNPVIESLALEAFRNLSEEFILKLCLTVRHSMLAARRTVPIACDFESVAQALDYRIPKEELLSYRTKPATNPPLLPTPPPDDIFHNHSELPAEFLGPDLDGRRERSTDAIIPPGLPALPSTHTYKATPVFSVRETDPRRVRELATEEGKLGEQALRKLAGAVKLENALQAESEAKPTRLQLPGPRRKKKAVMSTESIFQETMRDLMAEESDVYQKSFEVGPVVSSEKRYWKPDDTQVKRRPPRPGDPGDDRRPSLLKGRQPASGSGASIMNLDF